MLRRQTVNLRHYKRRIAAWGKLHHQRVVDAAAAQREQELLNSAVVSVVSANVAHSVQRTGTHNERCVCRIVHVACVVVRLIVTVAHTTRREAVKRPCLQCVEAGRERHTCGHGDRRRCTRSQRTVPRVTAGDAVYHVVDHRRVKGQGAKVLQLHIYVRRLRDYRRVIVREHQRRHTSIVQQRLVLLLGKHYCGPDILDKRRSSHLIVVIRVNLITGALAIEVLRFLVVRRSNHLDLHTQWVDIAVVDGLHHNVATSVIKSILEVDDQVRSCSCCFYCQR